ncbi:Inner membrane protein YccF [Fusobacterium sp. DD29]|jgi:uncharacterized membrane protein YccF (DUF307 family)|uniref:YccF domain-containing protein n=1 Tax=unclassified Fusobacterium TaxID=2648384 RepID=UPI001B8C1D64|nr:MULTISPECIES: YccF domain-containing protein [unclassified Fusobacterium]MBR8702289.1 Inner membrane protein YccF [Fusobacterium sp. DD45]MBR8712106.1 Inner membrane protein YccF [Fusobacterium sp. DD28]MBR8750278.1 Inner membrane protein YccF [Fusobacterium sp. DD29]MBR8752682.1 Inner membrane protein YccF [Fusobacterium sp. DD26]MBR8762524.1 Inner membrane protein YccF [Fusobacterium sp. DD25]
MNFLLNMLWLFYGGLFLTLQWLVATILSLLLIITIPFTSGCLNMTGACLMPFGKEVVLKEDAQSNPRTISAFFWIIMIGLWLAISHLVVGITSCLTVIGIPFGIQHFKLMKVAFNPYKYTLV